MGANIWDTNYTPGVDFLDHDFFIILKNSDQDLSNVCSEKKIASAAVQCNTTKLGIFFFGTDVNEGSNFILSSLEVGH